MGEVYAYTEEAQVAMSPDSVPKAKKKKGNFISRWMLKTLKGAVAEEQAEKERTALNSIKMPRGLQIGAGPTIDGEKGIRFQVYKAQGGYVVETSTFDRQRDRHVNGLHIINDGEKFGDRIEKIITMEALKQ